MFKRLLPKKSVFGHPISKWSIGTTLLKFYELNISACVIIGGTFGGINGIEQGGIVNTFAYMAKGMVEGLFGGFVFPYTYYHLYGIGRVLILYNMSNEK